MNMISRYPLLTQDDWLNMLEDKRKMLYLFENDLNSRSIRGGIPRKDIVKIAADKLRKKCEDILGVLAQMEIDYGE